MGEKLLSLISEAIENKDVLNETVSPETAHRILSMYGVKPGDNYFEHNTDTRLKVARDGKRLGIKHNASSRASGKGEDRHIFDRLTSIASNHHTTESIEWLDEILDESKSVARSGFDAEKAANTMMNHKRNEEHNFFNNHFMYGVRAAQKRHTKGTLDPQKLNKAGENLSKLGAWRVNDFDRNKKPEMPQNAEEHRQVGVHIAKHIMSYLDK